MIGLYIGEKLGKRIDEEGISANVKRGLGVAAALSTLVSLVETVVVAVFSGIAKGILFAAGFIAQKGKFEAMEEKINNAHEFINKTFENSLTGVMHNGLLTLACFDIISLNHEEA